MTMKTKTIFLALVAMTALFCACDDEEESTELDLKVNQLSYDGKVFDVETRGDWGDNMGFLDYECEKAGFYGTLDHHWENWESGKTVDLAKDGYPEDFCIWAISDSIQLPLPEVHFFQKEGEIDGMFYDNVFKSGTVIYTGSPEAEKLSFKLNAVLANGKSLKFWFEYKKSRQ